MKNPLGPLASICKPDASTEKQIRFKGKAYVLVGDMKFGGAIATREQYENGKCSFAHLCPDGLIRRFNEIIGTRDEITIKEKPLKFPYFRLSWHMDRSGKRPQPILRAFLRAVLAEVWWKRHLRWMGKRTRIYDKFKVLNTEGVKGKYATVKLPVGDQFIRSKDKAKFAKAWNDNLLEKMGLKKK